jgi:hypothetical protein
MLGCVGQRLGRHEVGCDFDRLGHSHIGRNIQVDRNHRTASESAYRRTEAALGEDRRVNPPGDLLKLLDRSHEPGRDAG